MGGGVWVFWEHRWGQPFPGRLSQDFTSLATEGCFLLPLEKVEVFLLPSLEYKNSRFCCSLILFICPRISGGFFVCFFLILLPAGLKSPQTRPSPSWFTQKWILETCLWWSCSGKKTPSSAGQIGGLPLHLTSRESEWSQGKLRKSNLSWFVISYINYNWQFSLIFGISQTGTNMLSSYKWVQTKAPVVSNHHFYQPGSAIYFHWDLQFVVFLLCN